MKNEQPSVPAGIRIYAIGDVHGRADLLAQLFSRIDADLAAHPIARPIQVLLGDYVDRGPNSREVIEQLILRSSIHEMICLKGNHETFIPRFLSDPLIFHEWRRLGGLETVVSYGVEPKVRARKIDHADLHATFNRMFPDQHRQFLAKMKSHFICGDYFFVHAGVRPKVSLNEQNEDDLLWIREDFLSYKRTFSKIIIHGHTPVVEPEILPNRINIDTGAYATGRLSCLMLEAEELLFV